MKPLQDQRIGLVGLGLMGRPMCINLQQAGAELYVANRSRAVLDEIRRPGIVPVVSPAELARRVGIVIVMVADTPAVENVLFGADGLIKAVTRGTLVIDMGTTAVVSTREFARRLGELDVEYVDAPVSGGEIGARNATLSIMAGGSARSIARARPLFDVLGSSFTHVGDVGAGQIAKAANQTIVGLTIGAVAEALALAESAGADPAKVREALLGGFAASRILELHGQRMIDREFRPGAKATTQLKDLRQALDLGTTYGLDLRATQLTMELYEKLIDAGYGDLDHSALFKLYDEEVFQPFAGDDGRTRPPFGGK